MFHILQEYIKLLVETKVREATISNGKHVPWGSREHVMDLENRIKDMVMWRSLQQRGTESRANYTRLINRLKSELRSAKKLATKFNVCTTYNKLLK